MGGLGKQGANNQHINHYAKLTECRSTALTLVGTQSLALGLFQPTESFVLGRSPDHELCMENHWRCPVTLIARKNFSTIWQGILSRCTGQCKRISGQDAQRLIAQLFQISIPFKGLSESYVGVFLVNLEK